MNLSFGGDTVPFICNIIIGPELENISPYNIPNKLKCGEVEKHIFLPTDNPPIINLSLPKEDTLGPMKTHNLSRVELEEKLTKHGISIDGKKKDLVARAKSNNPPMAATKKFRKVIKGWIGKQIGLLELLY